MPEAAPAEPTARQKRDMTNLGRIEGLLKIPGTPYVVLSVDGPVDPQRLADAADRLARRDKVPVILGGDGLRVAEMVEDDERETVEKVQGKQEQYAEAFGAALAAANELADADAPAANDPDANAEERSDPDPETLILTHLREHGPGSPQDIAAATGLPRRTATVELVRLNNAGRVTKNGLAYGLIAH